MISSLIIHVTHANKPGNITVLCILILKILDTETGRQRILNYIRRDNFINHTQPRVGQIRNAYNILVGKPEGKRPLGRPRSRWMDIRMDPRKTGWEVVFWLHLAQDTDQWRTVVNTVMNLWIP
jgi:hypothetical protein